MMVYVGHRRLFMCTEGHVQEVLGPCDHFTCDRNLRPDWQPALGCAQPSAPLTEVQEAAYKLGGEAALQPWVRRCWRCGRTRGAFNHRASTATPWHTFEDAGDAIE